MFQLWSFSLCSKTPTNATERGTAAPKTFSRQFIISGDGQISVERHAFLSFVEIKHHTGQGSRPALQAWKTFLPLRNKPQMTRGGDIITVETELISSSKKKRHCVMFAAITETPEHEICFTSLPASFGKDGKRQASNGSETPTNTKLISRQILPTNLLSVPRQPYALQCGTPVNKDYWEIFAKNGSSHKV